MTGTSRGSALRRAVLVVAGVVGLGTGGAAAKRALEPSDRSRQHAPRTLRLYARDLRLAPRRQSERGDRTGGRPSAAELLDDRLKPVGTFGASPIGASTTQLHTFTLPEGTILGLATASLEDAPHAVVGGTGRFAGASGSYIARAAPDLPGRSTELTFTILALEA